MENVHITSETGPGDKETVFAWLREFNHAENGPFMCSLDAGAEKEFFLVARDADGNTVGGLQGTLVHRWLKINVMAVSPEQRSRGIGRRLVAEAERRARQKGCDKAYVDTMSYQAPDFYRGLGYRDAGRLPDWDSHGHDKTFFFKKLGERDEE